MTDSLGGPQAAAAQFGQAGPLVGQGADAPASTMSVTGSPAAAWFCPRGALEPARRASAAGQRERRP